MGRGGRNFADAGQLLGARALSGRELRIELEAIHRDVCFDDAAVEAISDYAGDEIPYIVNQWLRTGAVEDDATAASPEQPAGLARRATRGLDRAFAAAPRLRSAAIVHRGLSVDEAKELLAAHEHGVGLAYKGFISTAIDPERARVFAEADPPLLRLRLPAETRLIGVAHVEGIHRYQHEEEVLLERGHRMRVLRTSADAIEAELLSPES